MLSHKVFISFPRSWWFLFFSITALSILVAQCASIQRLASKCDDVEVLSSELTAKEAEEFCLYAIGERRKVEAFWGPTWKRRIQIHADSSYRISRALIPAYQGNRGFMEMPLSRIRDKTGAVLHEIVHIYAPSNNRFLAEGLAVYLQDKMGENAAFPNFGNDLHVFASQRLSAISSLEALNNVRTPRRLGSIIEERTAYILAGSFVGFLIDKYGLPAFRSLYEIENYDQVYGRSLSTLENEWRAEIQRK